MKPSLFNLRPLWDHLSGWLRGFRQQANAFWNALLKDIFKGRIKREPVTGLRLRGNILEWTTVREEKTGLKIQADRHVTLEADEAVLSAPDKLAAEIRRHCSEISGRVSLGLSSEHMLLRVVDLPSTDPDEMAGMIKLQLDKFSPFPEERMAVSYERLQITAGGCRVLIAAVQKEIIDFASAVFQKTGMNLQRMDADVLGWWRVLTDVGAVPAAGHRILLLLESEGGILIAVQQGVPAAMKSVGSSRGLSVEDYAAELAHELGAFILALDLEREAAPVSGLDLWYRDPAPAALVERLKGELGREVHVHNLDSLPSLSEGLARRMLNPPFEASLARDRKASMVVDMIPAPWRAAEASLRMKRRLLAASILVLGLWLIIGLGFLGGYAWENRCLKELGRRMAAVQKPADEVRAMQRQSRSFEQYLDRKRSALECLREVSQALPADVSITAFQLKKGKSIVLRGEALSVNPIYDFKQALDKSPLFQKVDMGSTQPSKRKTATVQTFQMIIRLAEEQP